MRLLQVYNQIRSVYSSFYIQILLHTQKHKHGIGFFF